MYTRACTHAHATKRVHTRSQARAHACAHARTHVHTQPSVRTHAHTRSQDILLSLTFNVLILNFEAPTGCLQRLIQPVCRGTILFTSLCVASKGPVFLAARARGVECFGLGPQRISFSESVGPGVRRGGFFFFSPSERSFPGSLGALLEVSGIPRVRDCRCPGRWCAGRRRQSLLLDEKTGQGPLGRQDPVVYFEGRVENPANGKVLVSKGGSPWWWLKIAARELRGEPSPRAPLPLL